MKHSRAVLIMIMGQGSYGPFSALQKPHTELPAQSAWGNKYVKQLGVKQQWCLLPFSYSLYLRHRCTIGNLHKGPTAPKFFFSSSGITTRQKNSQQTNTNTHTTQPPLEDQSSQLLANEQITNQFGEQTLVRTGATGRGSGGRRGKWGGGPMRQMVNIQGSKQMNICLCFSRDNTTMFPVHRLGPGQVSGTVHRQERTLSGSLFLMAGWVEEEEQKGGLVASNLNQSYHGVLLCTGSYLLINLYIYLQ